MNRRTALLLGGLFLAVTGALFAAPPSKNDKGSLWFKPHTLKKGESLSLVAKQYYGEAWKYVYIASANRLVNQTKVDPGTQLRLPDIIVHQVKSDDTYTKLAQLYLGKSQFVPLIFWANQLNSKTAIKPGTTLVIPHILRHPIKDGQSLEDIADLYYRDKGMVKNLIAWNKLPSGNLSLTNVKSIWLPIREGLLTTMAAVKSLPKDEALTKIIADVAKPEPAKTENKKNIIAPVFDKGAEKAPTATFTPVPTPVETITAEATPIPEATPVPAPPAPIESTPRIISRGPETVMIDSHQTFDAASMALVKEQIRQARYSQALEIMQKIPLNGFKSASQVADYHWQRLVCYVALGERPKAIAALDEYLQTGEETIEGLSKQAAQLSPKIQMVLQEYRKNGYQRKQPSPAPN